MPYVRLAFGVILVYALLLVAVPPNPGRSSVGIVAVFCVGYCTLALVVGRSLSLSRVEVLAFSVGLAVLVVTLPALLASMVGIPISELVVVAVGLPIGLLASILAGPVNRSRRRTADSYRDLLDLSSFTSREKVAVITLYGAVVGALLVLLSLAFIPVPDAPSHALAILGPDGTPDTLPTNLSPGQTVYIKVSVLRGAEATTLGLRVLLVPQNATGEENFTQIAWDSPLILGPWTSARRTLSVEDGATWSEELAILVNELGVYELRFELLSSADELLAVNRLPVVVA